MSDIEWPWQYSFPPFFTIQPHAETKARQLQAWRSLVLDFHRMSKKSLLDVHEAQLSPLFCNSSIDRRLPVDGIMLILEDLHKTGNAEPLDKTRNRWFIYWYTLEKWATMIYSWAQTSGFTNSVCTIYELTAGDNTSDQEFHGLDQDVLHKVLQVLENRGKAEIISLDDSQGVKFF